MRISSVGKANSGVTLVELLIVVAIVGLIAGISFPAVSSGLESIRLSSAAGSLAAFLNSALNRAERRQQPVEITIAPKDNAVWVRSAEPSYERKLEMPDGVTIEAQETRRFLLLPGGTAPRIGIEIANRRGPRRIVRVDPLTGVPRIERVESR
jgi:prepilin-type N-terminal cleavage/methylation domain-containing protein